MLPVTDIKNFQKNKVLHNTRCLLAEDTYQNAQLLIKLLEQQHVIVKHVYNGRHAINEIDRTDFDFILMDLQMPVMGGFEAISLLRKRKDRRSDTLVIAVTAEKVSRQECLAAGFNELISKPFLPALFLEVLYKALTRKDYQNKEQVNQFNHTRLSNTVTEDDLRIDPSYLKAFSNGDEAFEKDMIASSLIDIDEKLAELQTNLSGRNILKVSRNAHTLKSLASIVGNKKMHMYFSSMETHFSESTYCLYKSEFEKIMELWNTLRILLQAHL